jgi:hypothetical protein
MVGDWNSYLDVERDTYRDNIMSTIPSTTANTTSHLQQLMKMLAHHHLYLHDPISRDKFTAYDNYTCFANNGKFRSILDKIFTSFPSEQCDKSIILDWDAYNNISLSDHRAVISLVSLASLCRGWIEYPKTPFTMYPRINVDNRTSDQVD